MPTQLVVVLVIAAAGFVAVDAYLGTGVFFVAARKFTEFLGWLAFWR